VSEEIEQEKDPVVEALERIAKDDKDGIIQPAAVVEAAKDPESPLHDKFEWDDAEAGHQYRLEQARQLIVKTKINVTQPEPEMFNVKIRLSDGSERRGYVTRERAKADPDLSAQVIDDAIRAIRSYRNRLSAFAEAQSLVSKLDEILAEIT
jgi:hypothetical protein